MKLILSRITSWFPLILVISGSLVMTAGLFTTSALAVTPVQIDMQEHSAVYVGANTCYTCHGDDSSGWSVPLELQSTTDVANQPKRIVAAVVPHQEVRQFDAGEVSEACTSADVGAPNAEPALRQYVVKTDTGASILPLDWESAEPAVPSTDSTSLGAEACTVYQDHKWKFIAARGTPKLSIVYGRPRLALFIRVNYWAAFVEGQAA